MTTGASNTYCQWDINKNEQSSVELLAEDNWKIKAISKLTKLVVVDDVGKQLRKYMEEIEAGICLPYISQGTLLGYMFLGKRKNDEPYSYEDMLFLDLLTPQLGISLDRLLAYSRVMQGFENSQKALTHLGLIREYSHEIKSPLNVLVTKARYGEQYSEAAFNNLKETIEKQVEKVTRILSTMLKISNDQRERQEREISIIKVIEHTLEMYPINGADLKKTLPADIPKIKGDFDDLVMLFTNLIKNALEAMVESEKKLIYITLKHLEEANLLQIEITDTGCGIPSDKLSLIWDSIASTKSHIGGNGIGLGAIKRVVKEHKATIEVQSTVGIGTTFRLLIPVSA